MALRLSGPIDLAVLDRRHGGGRCAARTLRTKIEIIGDQPCQIIAPAKPQKLPLVDLSEVIRHAAKPRPRPGARAEARRPFRLNEGPLFRALLLRLSATEHILVVVMHHVITDDWSMGVLFHELAALYAAFSAGGTIAAAETADPICRLRRPAAAKPARRNARSAAGLLASAACRACDPGIADGPSPPAAGQPCRGHAKRPIAGDAGQSREGVGATRRGHALHDPAGGIPGAAAPLQRPG